MPTPEVLLAALPAGSSTLGANVVTATNGAIVEMFLALAVVEALFAAVVALALLFLGPTPSKVPRNPKSPPPPAAVPFFAVPLTGLTVVVAGVKTMPGGAGVTAVPFALFPAG